MLSLETAMLAQFGGGALLTCINNFTVNYCIILRHKIKNNSRIGNAGFCRAKIIELSVFTIAVEESSRYRSVFVPVLRVV